MTKSPQYVRDGLAPPRRAAIVGLATLTALILGCTLSSPDEGIGVASQAAMNFNSMNPNALNPNAMNFNALRPAALSANALDPGAMDPSATSALEDPGAAGDLSRELLLYAVSCAFSADQSFGFSWTDEAGTVHAEVYPGLLGLAPSWATEPLDGSGQQWVSDCLASRVNAKGVSVLLSSRGTSPALACTPDELAAFQTREAVFFGNLFTSTPQIYACYDPLSMLPSQLQDRVCAQPPILDIDLLGLFPTYDCGPIEVIGPCYQVLGLITLGFCAGEAAAPERYFYDCSPSPGSPSSLSITTFLRGSIPW